MDKILAPIKARIIQFAEIKKITKKDFFEELGVSASNFRSSGLKSEVGGDVIAKILAQYPEINPQWLITGDGEMFKEINPPNLDDSKDIAVVYDREVKSLQYTDQTETLSNTHGNIFHLYANGAINIEVIKVPFPAYASYVEAYQDETKLREEFDTITFKVDHIGRGNYIAFTTQGDSMNAGGIDDTPEGADVLAREIGHHLWCDNGFRKTKYGFIVITKTGIYHKDITDFNCDDGLASLSSRNKSHADIQYPINDIIKIFHVIKRSF